MKVRLSSFRYYKVIACFVNLLIMASTLTGCEKEEWPTYRLVPEFKDYVLFTVGSYWVYNQEGSTKRDSVGLCDQDFAVLRRRSLASYIEQLDQSFWSSFYKDTLLGYSDVYRSRDTVICLYIQRFQSKLMDGNLQFYTGLPVGEITRYNGAMEIKFSQEYDSYTINGTVYRDVKAFENTVVLDSIYVKKIYYARGVGVIRKELFNGEVWNLERYKID